LGDLVLDIVATARQEVSRGSDVPGTVRFRAGGSAANTARAFARLGGRASLVTSIGDDAWGRRLVAAVRADRVTVHAVAVPRPSARLVAIVGAQGERSFVTDRGAADRLAPGDVRDRWIDGTDALHLPGYSLFTQPLARAAARAAVIARERGAVVSVDLASRVPLLAMGRVAARDAIGSLEPSILLGNREEAAALIGSREERLLDLAPVVVIKEGDAGCRVLTRGPDAAAVAGRAVHLAVATTPVRAVDTTGAGDAFDAGFLHALLTGSERKGMLARDAASLRRAAVAGHRAAAAVLTGPRPELP
jgi:sugar/nucleoside kinase (ribokinase family)